jgi:hypothetical protein
MVTDGSDIAAAAGVPLVTTPRLRPSTMFLLTPPRA